MANFQQKTQSMVLGQGYVIPLNGANAGTILARVPCRVQLSDASPAQPPAAPTTDPLLGPPGTLFSWLDMQAGEMQSFGGDNAGVAQPAIDFVNYVIVFALANGNVVINAH